MRCNNSFSTRAAEPTEKVVCCKCIGLHCISGCSSKKKKLNSLIVEMILCLDLLASVCQDYLRVWLLSSQRALLKSITIADLAQGGGAPAAQT